MGATEGGAESGSSLSFTRTTHSDDRPESPQHEDASHKGRKPKLCSAGSSHMNPRRTPTFDDTATAQTLPGFRTNPRGTFTTPSRLSSTSKVTWVSRVFLRSGGRKLAAPHKSTRRRGAEHTAGRGRRTLRVWFSVLRRRRRRRRSDAPPMRGRSE